MTSKHVAGLLGALAIVIAGCGAETPTGTPTKGSPNTSSPSATMSQAPTSTDAPMPGKGGTVTVGLDADMVWADPSLVSDTTSLYVMAQVIQGLVGLKPGTVDDVVPVLAASLPEVSADGLTYTFALRRGIKFHDGTDLDAAAVKYNYDRWTAYPNGSELRRDAYDYGAVFGGFGDASNLASVDAPDAATVVFHLKNKRSAFLMSQTLGVFGIQSPTAMKKYGANSMPLASDPYANGRGASMVGTGPFIFKEWVRGDHITLIRNPNYWDAPNVAYVDQIIFKPITDSIARLHALQAGGVDLAETISPSDAQTARGLGFVVIDRGQPCNLSYLGMNQTLGGKPTVYANTNVRLAVAAALNKPLYLASFYGGSDAIAQGLMPQVVGGFKAEPMPGYDAKAAKDMLATAGLSAGQLSLDLFYPSNVAQPYVSDPRGLAQAIGTDLQAIGFTVNLRAEDWASQYVPDMNSGRLSMFLTGWTCAWAGADDFLYTGLLGYQGGQPNVRFGYRNDAMNQDMLDALSAATPEQANQSWGRAQDRIAQDMPVVPLIQSTSLAAYDSKIQGFVGSANLDEQLNTIWIP